MSTCSRRSHGLLRLLWGTHDSNQTLPWPTREMARLYAHKANRCNFSVTHVALRRPAVGDTWCTLHMGQLAPLSQSFALVTGHTRSTSTPCKPNTQDGAIVRMEVSSADGGGQGPGGPWWGNVAVIGDSRCTLTYRPTGAALAVFCACYGVNMIHSNPLQVQHAKRRDSSHGSFIAGVVAAGACCGRLPVHAVYIGRPATPSRSFALAKGYIRSRSTPCKPNTRGGAIIRMEAS
jgi:hypothetical protein